jgi:hypothetical protein
MTQFNRVQVFSATLARDRAALGERVTAFLKDNSNVEVVDTVVRQSSDREFHCLSIVMFMHDARKRRRGRDDKRTVSTESA